MTNLYGKAVAELERLRAEIGRLQEAKRAALKIADERSKENVALRAALSALKSDTKPLVDFVRWAIQEGSWVGADIPGDVVQDKAEELGLITRTKYDPKIHGESDIADQGDDWYVFGPLIADKRGEG